MHCQCPCCPVRRIIRKRKMCGALHAFSYCMCTTDGRGRTDGRTDRVGVIPLQPRYRHPSILPCKLFLSYLTADVMLDERVEAVGLKHSITLLFIVALARGGRGLGRGMLLPPERPPRLGEKYKPASSFPTSHLPIELSRRSSRLIRPRFRFLALRRLETN